MVEVISFDCTHSIHHLFVDLSSCQVPRHKFLHASLRMAWSWHESLSNLVNFVLSSRILLKSCIDKSIQIRAKLASSIAPGCFFIGARPSQNPPLRNGPTWGAKLNWSSGMQWSHGPVVPNWTTLLCSFYIFHRPHKNLQQKTNTHKVTQFIQLKT